tara:strand:- start:1395 stop:2612 length:1218 start_codon:yes stop_codon:yes gene_type:complete
MSFSVTKSSVINFDNATTAALETVLTTLKKQSQHVKSVSVLANFSVDHETTIAKRVPVVVQGLVVQTTKEYKLSEEDKSWFHPCVTKGRSVYSIQQSVAKSSLQQLDLDTLGNSVGEYSISHADEFGCEQMENRIIIDVSAEKTFESAYNKWLQEGTTAGELDAEMKRMKFGNTYSVAAHVEELRNDIAKELCTDAKLIHSDMSHGILSDLSSVYFVNAAVKTSPAILVKSSSLGGYRMYNTHNDKQKFYPANLGKSIGFYSWDELSQQNCAKITDTCMWKGSLTANAQVMRPLSIKSPKEMEQEYNISLNDTLKMTHCAFSPSDSFIDNIEPSDVLRITPTSAQNRKASDSMSAPFNMEHPVLHKLMNNIQDIQAKFPNFKLFNPKVVSGGRITLPREVYKNVI